MKRLREETDSTDPTIVAAGRLLSQVRPYDESEVRAQRVRRALERKALGSRFHGILLGAFVLLGLGGTAAAALGAAKWLTHSAQDLAAPRSSEHVRAHRTSSEEPGPAVHDTGAASPRKESPTPNEPQSIVPVTTTTPPSASVSSPRAPSATSKTQASADGAGANTTPSLSEARLVQEAVAALRSGEDPEKAERLLAEYRAKSTSGTLDEEALALSIEVALAKRDPRARDYARRYLKNYPHGKFTGLAKRALK